MATSQNTNNTKLGIPLSPNGEGDVSSNNTAKQNYTGIRYGNDHGSISFGHIHKQADVTSDVMLQASDGRHSIILDKDGPRKGCTQITSPGRISIDCGIDKSEAEDVLLIHSHNGNIIIKASNGKLRLEGTDVEIIASGEGGTKGNITFKASNTVSSESNKFIVNAKNFLGLKTPGLSEISANAGMSLYSSLIRGVSDAVANRDSKVGGASIYRKNNK